MDGVNFAHHTHFREFVSQKAAVDISISVDSLLARTHEVYQLLMSDIKRKDADLLFAHIKTYINDVSEQMKTSMNTILENQDYVRNALATHYSNGIIEGMNNCIKVLKRIAFGYRFFHFRNRILIAGNLIKPKAIDLYYLTSVTSVLRFNFFFFQIPVTHQKQ